MASYTIQQGDSLSKIAQYYTGDKYAYGQIMTLNPLIANPDFVVPGQVIEIPDSWVADTTQPIADTTWHAPMVLPSNVPDISTPAPAAPFPSVPTPSVPDATPTTTLNSQVMTLALLALLAAGGFYIWKNRDTEGVEAASNPEDEEEDEDYEEDDYVQDRYDDLMG